jgi:DNA-binding HxlR family transcriptional regulator
MDSNETLLVHLVEIFKALGDATRLRILGTVAERPRPGKELGELLSVSAPTMSHHLAKLVAAGLVSVKRDGQSHIYRLDERALAATSRLVTQREEPVLSAGQDHDDDSRERAKVLRDFFDGARLKQIPAQRKKRVIVLQHLMKRFDPTRTYGEKEVSAILREAHEDFATLRRELVDYGFMSRTGGVYRVAHDLPFRSVQVDQEITGDEHAWLRQLLTSATNK